MQINRTLFLVVIAALVGLGGALLASSYFFSNFKTSVISTFPVPDCDVLLSPCHSSLPTGETVSLTLSATILPTMIPLDISVETEGLDPLAITVDFSGVDMYMGNNQPILSRKEGQLFVGKTILPICSKHRMPWEATVYIDTKRGRIAAPFEFSVIKPASSLT